MERFRYLLGGLVLVCIFVRPASPQANPERPRTAEDSSFKAVPRPVFNTLDDGLRRAISNSADAPSALARDDIEIDLQVDPPSLLDVPEDETIRGVPVAHVSIAHLFPEGDPDPASIDYSTNDPTGDFVDPFVLAYYQEHFYRLFGVDLFLLTADCDEDEATSVLRTNDPTSGPILTWIYDHNFDTSSIEFALPVLEDPEAQIETGLDPKTEFYSDWTRTPDLPTDIRAEIPGYRRSKRGGDRVDRGKVNRSLLDLLMGQLSGYRFDSGDLDELKEYLIPIPIQTELSTSFFDRRVTIDADLVPEFRGGTDLRGFSSRVKVIYPF